MSPRALARPPRLDRIGTDFDSFVTNELRQIERWTSVLSAHDNEYDELLVAMSDGSVRSRPELAAGLKLCRLYLGELGELTPVREYREMQVALIASLESAVTELEAEVETHRGSTSDPILGDAAVLYERAHVLSGQAAKEVQKRYEGKVQPDLN